MRQEIVKELNKLNEEYDCFDQRELDMFEEGDDIWSRLHDKDTYLDHLNFKLEITTHNKFDFCLTYNGFGDLSIEECDKLIDQLKRKKKIMQELERFKGVEL